MLQVKGVSKAYGSEAVLHSVTFNVNPGERAALVGPNGCGKTTLLRIIAGEESADAGAVSRPRESTLGYLPQGFAFSGDLTVEAVLRGGVPGYAGALAWMRELESRIASSEGASTVTIDEYSRAVEEFEILGGYAIETHMQVLLDRLGLFGVRFDTPVTQLSGGQQTRLGLARLLLAEPTFLLLDEPTNHLDISAIEWLETFLASYRGALLIVSHDRLFLDRTVTRIIEIDAESHHARAFAGNYTDYARIKATELDKQWAAWTDQQEEDEALERAIHLVSQRASRYQNISKNDFQRRKSKVLMQKAMAQKTRLERQVGSDDRVEKPKEGWALRVDFGEMPRGGQEAITLQNAGHSYDGLNYLFRGASLLLRHGERVALIGPNGSGKSTLLRAIAGELALSEGVIRIGANVRIGYMPQGQETLTPRETPFSVIQASASTNETPARNFLHYFLFSGDDVFTPVERLSYGQRARLLLARIIAQGANCLVLDEPLNHLDIPSQEKFEEALAAFPGAVLVAAHDRAFIDRFATGIWSLEHSGIVSYLSRADMRP
ncbi:MAG: ABC-F family ATP-binding cassette domain-containing protein [Anaerolineae bacterium]|nr:ABC-F family ATP-binding cassette domain-containing protein [Anaerolineae bacterium]